MTLFIETATGVMIRRVPSASPLRSDSEQGLAAEEATHDAAAICDPSPWVANAKPFVVTSASQFRTAGPLPLGSAAWAAEFQEVKAIGSLTSATRLPAQTHAAAFWQTNPAANYNAIARRFVDQFSLNVSDSARLFAMLDLGAADALINTWNDKYYWNWWRPITAIRHPDDSNPDLTNEVLEARIWAGIHFRAVDVQAANLGREVERYIHKHQFAFVN